MAIREYRAAVAAATNTFVYGGWAPYDVVPGLSPGQIRVVLPREPRFNERFTGDLKDPFRHATIDELGEELTLTVSDKAQRQLAADPVRAVLLEALADVLASIKKTTAAEELAALNLAIEAKLTEKITTESGPPIAGAVLS